LIPRNPDDGVLATLSSAQKRAVSFRSELVRHSMDPNVFSLWDGLKRTLVGHHENDLPKALEDPVLHLRFAMEEITRVVVEDLQIQQQRIEERAQRRMAQVRQDIQENAARAHRAHRASEADQAHKRTKVVHDDNSDEDD
jgi:hypothetical protein